MRTFLRAFAVSGFGLSVVCAQAQLYELGTLGGTYSESIASSSDGSVIAGQGFDSQGIMRGFVWTESTGMVMLQSVGNAPCFVTGISGDGKVIVGNIMVTKSISHGFRWTQEGVMVDLSTLPADTMSECTAVSADGSTIIGTSTSSQGNVRAFRWTAGQGMKDLGLAAHKQQTAVAVTPDGSTISGTCGSPAPKKVYRWNLLTGAVMLEGISGSGVYVHRLSADGNVIVGSNNADGFRWTPLAGFMSLMTPDVKNISGTGVSADGSVVAGTGVSTGNVQNIYRWSSGSGLVNLGNLGGASVFYEACSADGNTIAGWGQIPAGSYIAFVWTPFEGLRMIGTPGSQNPIAKAISRDGSTVLGYANDAQGHSQAIRWVKGGVTRVVSGKVLFDDFVGLRPTTANFQFRDSGTGALLSTWTSAIGLDGSFIAKSPGTRTYDISLKIDQWLKKTVRVDLAAHDATNVNFRLKNGDCNRDNYVGTDDYLIVNAAFDKAMGQPGFDPRADLDGDGFIGTNDYLIVSANFDLYGD